MATPPKATIAGETISARPKHDNNNKQWATMLRLENFPSADITQERQERPGEGRKGS